MIQLYHVKSLYYSRDGSGEWGRCLRFHTQHIAHPPCLIPIRSVRLADRVDVIDADKPFVLSEFDLAAEVVQVAD